jgi:hypothetical protein
VFICALITSCGKAQIWTNAVAAARGQIQLSPLSLLARQIEFLFLNQLLMSYLSHLPDFVCGGWTTIPRNFNFELF